MSKIEDLEAEVEKEALRQDRIRLRQEKRELQR